LELVLEIAQPLDLQTFALEAMRQLEQRDLQTYFLLAPPANSSPPTVPPQPTSPLLVLEP
jgi:hypothetical protein